MTAESHQVVPFEQYIWNFLQARIGALVNDSLACLLPAMWPDGGIPFDTLASQIATPHQGFSRFVRERLTLPPEVTNHHAKTLAPGIFTALLGCLAHLELLASLCTGRYRSPDPKSYAVRFMGYDPGKTDLIFQLFRHNLAHFAMPPGVLVLKHDISIGASASILKKGDAVTWAIDIGHSNQHLNIQTYGDADLNPQGVTPWRVRVTHKIFIDVLKLLEDLTHSVYGPKKYYETLLQASELELRLNFKKVIRHLYPPHYSQEFDNWV